MAMPLEKAKKILKTYKDNNYNAKKSLIAVGYSKETADMQSARTIDTAVNSLVRAGDHKSIYEFVGVNQDDIAKEYREVIKQNKNYPAKLRALEPLLKLNGIQWDETKNVTTVPVLNLTVTDNVAQQSHIDGSTWGWKCSTCPFIGFEYYRPSDIEGLKTIV